jgi:monofunctional glycosyltransferase
MAAKRKSKKQSAAFARSVGFMLLAGVGLVGAAAVYVVVTWPNVAALATEAPETTAFISRFEDTRRSAGESEEIQWTWVDWDRISPNLKKAVVVAEDIEFFSHPGFSTTELRNAIKDALEEGKAPRGASTITQQLAKNLWLSPSRNPLRKFKEAILTTQLEEKLEKQRILELYLNVVEFGPGIYGAEAAARHYYGRSAQRLTRRQAALLAASLPRPSTWNPHTNSNRYLASADRIEGWMIEARFLHRYVGEPERVRRW